MPNARRLDIPTIRDDRGTIVISEFDDVPFPVRRMFTVTGVEPQAMRGNHVVPCDQLIILIGGQVTVKLGSSAETVDDGTSLNVVGSALLVKEGTYIQYFLADSKSSIVVLAAQPYASKR